MAGWLGLIALAVHFLLAFAHHHHDPKLPALASAIDASAANGTGGSDGDNDPSDCGICWALGLTAAVALPTLIGLSASGTRRGAFERLPARPVAWRRIARAFDARGPPRLLSAT